MTPPEDADQVAPGIFVWQVYDSSVKAELFSTALMTEAGLFLVDPIPLNPNSLSLISNQGQAGGIVVTNENHLRATSQMAEQLATKIYIHQELLGSPDFPGATGVQDGEIFSSGLKAIWIKGGPPGETALHQQSNGGTVVLGDALINFEPHGFGFLPAKYCRDHREMRRSLRKLLDYQFDRMLFAHGTPILSGARARLELLLSGDL